MRGWSSCICFDRLLPPSLSGHFSLCGMRQISRRNNADRAAGDASCYHLWFEPTDAGALSRFPYAPASELP